MNIEDIRLTLGDMQTAIWDMGIKLESEGKEVTQKDRLTTIANTATDKANQWWIEWVERALLVHPDNRDTWKAQYFEALKKLVEEVKA